MLDQQADEHRQGIRSGLIRNPEEQNGFTAAAARKQEREPKRGNRSMDRGRSIMSPATSSALLVGLVALLGLLLASPGTRADDPLVLPLWPGKAVGDYGAIGEERIRAPEDAPT